MTGKMMTTLLVFAMFITGLAVYGCSQETESAKLSSSVAGRRTAAYLSAYNSGDEQRMRAFLLENVSAAALQQRPIDSRLEVYRQMRENIGSMDLQRVAEVGEDAVSIIIRTRRGEWRKVKFMFDKEQEHKFMTLRVEDVDDPQLLSNTADQPKTISKEDLVGAVEKLISELADHGEFSGVVLMAKADTPRLMKAYGMADIEQKIPNRVDSTFNIGSITNIFTQVAIQQLIDQGKISLDDKVGKFLPDFPNRDVSSKVTVRQLLDMTSGIGDFFVEDFQATPKNKLQTISDYLPLFASKPLLFEPGSNRQYSNGGYIVLGLIIEKATGTDYYDYVHRNIFKPAGMTNSDWSEPDKLPSYAARGYTRDGAQDGRSFKSNRSTLPGRGSSAGGSYSTLQDLLSFSLALQSGKFRLPAIQNEPGSAGSNAASPEGFRGVGIAGGSPGVNAVLEIDPRTKWTVIVLSNFDPPSAENVGRQIHGWIDQIEN